ncbi:ECF transporter S component [uncultured Faecalicoccus sp.]|uniref:ECF transporter S component n=1 Tax=uncultured Faecalicoccus sp. TaxID=1971760 RepID=UPI002632B455|nr:ECF transporter S component [uncultured Faecalicoccus sp.]
MNQKTREIVITSLCIAMIFIATMFIKIPNAFHGYINLGDGFILLSGCLLKPSYAFLAGGLGSGLADIAGGYGYYFIFTLIIKGFEGWIVSYVSKKSERKTTRILSYFIGSIIMIAGYFIADFLINQSIWIGLASVWGNLFQAGMGLIISVIGYPIIRKLWPIHH